MKTAKIRRPKIREIFVMLFCLFVATSALGILFFGYDPNQNAIGAFGSVCMDTICLLILFALIGSFAFSKHYGSNRTTRLYGVMLLASVWALFLDFLNWAFDGALELGHLTYWFTVGSLCMGAVLACLFSVYLYSYMAETHGLRRMHVLAKACAALNLLSFGLTFALAVTGTAFQFVDGHYEGGKLYDVVTVIPILTLIALLGYVVYQVKRVGIHDALVVAGYIFIMVMGALVEAKYNVGTTYVAVAIADIFIFVMLQNDIIAREKQKVQEWKIRSNTDELTGCFNRHAYEEDLALLEGGKVEHDLVYVSADVNSLKVVNDSIGHNAGDEILVGASECLNKCFGSYGKVYRIGGDEFIAIIHVEKDKLPSLQKKLEDITKQWTGKLVNALTISCGYVSGNEAKGGTVRQMAILADQRMYAAKSSYYKETGMDRRRR